MITLAFYYESQESASAARSAMRRGNGIDESAVALAPLVVEGVEGTILALSAEPGRVAQIVELARAHGGRLVAEVPNDWL